MKTRFTCGFVAGSLLVLVSLRSVPSFSAAAAEPSSETGLLPVRDLQWRGVGSCTSSNCHGGDTRDGLRGSEYAVWARLDPHARAFQVLSNERSQRIVRNLADGDERRAPQRPLCLACHADPAPANHRAPDFTLEDGVGCESCHGPAQKWLSNHYLDSWKTLTPAEKEALGMHPTKQLETRLQQCVGCHVGSEQADVNHDLIAAGHPRLRFEAGSYLARMPHHWDAREDKARYPDFEARAWALGQVESARRALDLLAARAAGAAAGHKPWPEFAEYDCFACHHELTVEPTHTPREDHKLGSLVWGNWYYTLLPDLESADAGAGRQAVPNSLRTLRQSMEKPSPDADRVALEAKTAARELEPWAARLGRESLNASRVQGLLKTVVRDDAALAASTWDRAVQHYLADAALYNGLTDLDPGYRSPERRDALIGLRRLLSVPDAYDSPQNYSPVSVKAQLKLIEQRFAR